MKNILLASLIGLALTTIMPAYQSSHTENHSRITKSAGMPEPRPYVDRYTNRAVANKYEFYSYLDADTTRQWEWRMYRPFPTRK